MTMVGPIPLVAVRDRAPVDSTDRTFDRLLASEPSFVPVPVGPHDPALILYTLSGTGKPKGAVHSHAYRGIHISGQIFDLSHESRVLVGKPTSHAGGLETQVVPTLLAGGEVTLTMKPIVADAVALIRKYQVTEYAMVAVTYWILSST